MRSVARSGARCQRGQTTSEFLGVIVVIAALIGVLAVSPIGTFLRDAIEQAICMVAGEECGEPGGAAPAPVDPHLTPAERSALVGEPRGAQEVLATLSPEELEWLEANDPESYAGARRADSWKEELALTDHYTAAALDDFLSYRNSGGRDPRLDFTTDLCSAPLVGSTGISFDFTNACIRHDFGYRNYKRLDIFDDKKGGVDDRFLDDMKDHCASRSIVLKPSCYRCAYTFYGAVKAFG